MKAMQSYSKTMDLGNAYDCPACEKGNHADCHHHPAYDRCGCAMRGHGQPLVSYEITQRVKLQNGQETVRVLEHGKCTEKQLKSIGAMAVALGYSINVSYPSRWTRMGTGTLEDWMRRKS